MSTAPKPAAKPADIYPPVHLDNSKAAVGVWLVKVPKYLAKKWNEAPDNAEVGRIRITQSNMGREVAFHLNEQLGQTVTIKVGDKSFDEKIPLEHKFITTPLGSQDVFVLKQQEEGAKEVLQTIGKVMQRAECVPITTDTRYLKLKRETMKNHIEPKRQIKMADGFVQRHHYLPKSNHAQSNDKKDKTKRLRKDKDKVLDILFHAFTKHQYYNIKNLEKITQQPTIPVKNPNTFLNSSMRQNPPNYQITPAVQTASAAIPLSLPVPISPITNSDPDILLSPVEKASKDLNFSMLKHLSSNLSKDKRKTRGGLKTSGKSLTDNRVS